MYVSLLLKVDFRINKHLTKSFSSRKTHKKYRFFFLQFLFLLDKKLANECLHLIKSTSD